MKHHRPVLFWCRARYTPFLPQAALRLCLPCSTARTKFGRFFSFLPAELFEKTGAALFFGEKLAQLATNIMLISAPIVLACLFADAALGLVNRFAPQLNVYVLAIPVKCAAASFLLLFYFAVLMSDAPERFAAFGVDLSVMRLLLQ